jgi:hypothetical protein
VASWIQEPPLLPDTARALPIRGGDLRDGIGRRTPIDLLGSACGHVAATVCCGFSEARVRFTETSLWAAGFPAFPTDESARLLPVGAFSAPLQQGTLT